MTSTKKRILQIITLLFVFGLGFLIGCGGDIPFLMKKSHWSIGIYTGSSPFNLSQPSDITNPVLTAEDVTDMDSAFIADPFMIKDQSTWYLFFETLDKKTLNGDIALATSTDGKKWEYQQIVLNEIFHLSYPYVFKWENDYYMIPESSQAYSVRLYKAKKFPTEWEFVTTLLDNGNYADNSIAYYNNTWWLFSETDPQTNGTLRLFYADNLTGPWTEHPESPIVMNNEHTARPGGRVLPYNNALIRFAQDDAPTYGNQVHAFEITTLTKELYEEHEITESPVLQAGEDGWNEDGMHTIDAHQLEDGQWMSCVDGINTVTTFVPKWKN